MKTTPVCALILLSLGGSASAQNWGQKLPSTNPIGRQHASMAFDTARNQVVMFGGIYIPSGTMFSETWVWDGANWTQKSPAAAPSARYLQAMAYDAAHGQTVLFGGYNVQTSFSDTWVWDGTNWTQKSPQTVPTSRYGHGMAYDAVNQQVVMFGGYSYSTGTALSDTWVWDGTNWTQKSPQTSPPAGYFYQMTYDAARSRTVLFGGSNAFGGVLNDTWLWDGNNWSKKTPANVPTARYWHQLSYDSAHALVILYGGAQVTNTDMWAWDGTNWTQKTPTTSPSYRSGHTMTYDEGHGHTVLFGGAVNGGYIYADTWLYPSNTIVASGGTPQSTPAGTTFPAALEVTVTDINNAPVSGDVIHFSGSPSMVTLSAATAVTDSSGKARITATATQNQGSYTVTAIADDTGIATFSLTNTAPPPPPPSLSIFKSHSGNFTQGQQGATYTVTVSNAGGTSPTSGTITVTETPPSGEALASMAGAGWTCTVNAATCTRSDSLAPGTSFPSITVTVNVAANAPSPQTNKVSVSGGGSAPSNASDPTTITSLPPPPPPPARGAGWLQKFPTTTPPRLFHHAMAYDAARREVVLFGGSTPQSGPNVQNPYQTSSQTWTWDGRNWTQQSPATDPGPQTAHVMAYDAANREVVLLGTDYSKSAFTSATWVWTGNNWTKKSPATNPPWRQDATMSYDAARGRVVLFGGFTPVAAGPGRGAGIAADTWVWDGTNWTQESPLTSPPGRGEAMMTYDLNTGETLLFGGNNLGTTFSDTWGWNGTNWTQKSPASNPGAHALGAMAYYAANQRTILFGGYGGPSDTWAWDGTTWGQEFPLLSPPGRASFAMADDAARGELVLFGGQDATGSILNDTWVYSVRAPASITANAGTTPQSATAGQVFSTRLAVTVSDASQRPVPGVVVTFTAPATGASGRFANGTNTTQATSNANGVATATHFIANLISGGPYNVVASSPGIASVNFALTNTALTMTANSGTTPQSTPIGKHFANQMAVTIRDINHNPMQGVVVTFTAPSSGPSGTFSNGTNTTNARTNASGVAMASTFKANTTAGGPYNVTASALGVSSVNFALTNLALTMTVNAGTTPQTANTGTAFANHLAVTVRDSNSNPVSGVVVTFTAPSSGPSGTFANGTNTTNARTNASGVATASIFKANATAGGPYNVTASSRGIASVNFALTNH